MIDGEEDWGAVGEPAGSSAEPPLDPDLPHYDPGSTQPETRAGDVPEGVAIGEADPEGGTAARWSVDDGVAVDDHDHEDDQQVVEQFDAPTALFAFEGPPDPAETPATGWGTDESIEELSDPGWLDAETLPDMDSNTVDPVSDGPGADELRTLADHWWRTLPQRPDDAVPVDLDELLTEVAARSEDPLISRAASIALRHFLP